MSGQAAPRFAPLDATAMTDAQRRVINDLTEGPRKGVRGPFQALLRSPVLADRFRHFGDYVRFENSLPPATMELAVLMTALFWSAKYEWYAHRRLSAAAGLDPSVIEDLARGRRPQALDTEQQIVYDLCRELLTDKDVSDITYRSAVERVGERGVVDLLTTVGYYGMVSLILNTDRHPVPVDAPAMPVFAGFAA